MSAQQIHLWDLSKCMAGHKDARKPGHHSVFSFNADDVSASAAARTPLSPLAGDRMVDVTPTGASAKERGSGKDAKADAKESKAANVSSASGSIASVHASSAAGARLPVNRQEYLRNMLSRLQLERKDKQRGRKRGSFGGSGSGSDHEGEHDRDREFDFDGADGFEGDEPEDDDDVIFEHDKALLRTFSGFHQSRFVVRSCFGGSAQQFVVSGSEGALVCFVAACCAEPFRCRFASLRVASRDGRVAGHALWSRWSRQRCRVESDQRQSVRVR